jgi:hypothetical protein
MYFSSYYCFLFLSLQSRDENQMSLSSLLEASVKGKEARSEHYLACVRGSFKTFQDRREYSKTMAHETCVPPAYFLEC